MKKRYRGDKKPKFKFEKRSSKGGWKKVATAGRGAAAFANKKTSVSARRATPHARPNREVSPAFAKKSAAAKLVQSLQDKKARAERKLFLVEGETSVLDALQSGFAPHSLFVTHAFLDEYPEIRERYTQAVHIVDEQELSGMGTLAMNRSIIGVFAQPQLPPLVIASEVVIALASISDPGNLGTIIRIADWYGIRKIVASSDTVDIYNPKTISATKGSFARVQVYYEDLETFLGKNVTVPVFAADMQGENVHDIEFPTRGILLLGNETHGIPNELSDVITKYVTIPRFGGAESLNVAIAGAVILDNWFR